MKQITLTVNEQQLNVIGKGLGLLPYNEAVTVIEAIRKQIKHNEATKVSEPERQVEAGNSND